MSAVTVSSVAEGPEIEYDGRPVLYVVEAPAPVRRVRQARPAPRSAPRPVRLTRRGRGILVLAFLALALGLMVAFGGWATATLTGGTPDPVQVVEVQPGQTLYDIAGQVARPGHIREMVYKIEEMNSLPSATISEGQKLAIPQG
jgi:hypothetical protein